MSFSVGLKSGIILQMAFGIRTNEQLLMVQRFMERIMICGTTFDPRKLNHCTFQAREVHDGLLLLTNPDDEKPRLTRRSDFSGGELQHYTGWHLSHAWK